MKKIEDRCVDCPKEIGCLGNACPYKNVEVFYCDACGAEGANYHIEEEDLCEDCANKTLNYYFSELTIAEKIKLLNVQPKELPTCPHKNYEETVECLKCQYCNEDDGGIICKIRRFKSSVL